MPSCPQASNKSKATCLFDLFGYYLFSIEDAQFSVNLINKIGGEKS